MIKTGCLHSTERPGAVVEVVAVAVFIVVVVAVVFTVVVIAVFVVPVFLSDFQCATGVTHLSVVHTDVHGTVLGNIENGKVPGAFPLF